MITLRLERVMRNESSTRGVLVDIDAGKILAVTLELPWRNNDRGVSCIPPGSYLVNPADSSTRFGNDWAWVQNVDGRTRIGIHAGNFTYETRGCILVGNGFFTSGRNGDAIANSRKTLASLLDYVGDAEFRLNITSPSSVAG